MVCPDSAPALASGISRLLNDPAYRQHLPQQGLRRAAELSMKNMVDRYQSVFQQIAQP
jgi:glycosyltransferase involved in cell wall biosynthesis